MSLLKIDNSLRTSLLKLLLFQSQFGAKRFFNSYYITRCFEYPLAFNTMELKQGLRVLDFGCGNSLFSIYLAHCGIKTFCLDIINSTVLDFRQFLINSKFKFLLNNTLYHTLYGGEKIPYKGEMFDRIFAISTLEHLQGEKDIIIIRQFERLLRKKGKVFISVEFCNYYKEITPPMNKSQFYNWEYKSDFVDFVRYYDKEALFERIIKPSQLKVANIVCFGSRRINIRMFVDKLGYAGFLNPLFAQIFYKELNNKTELEKCYHAYPYYLSNIIACIVLEKT